MFAKCLLLLVIAVEAARSARVVCYWNGKSFWREGTAKVTSEELKSALGYCTHLVYGFAEIDDDDYKIEPIDKKLDLDKGKGQYRAVTGLKRAQPGLSVLLSVGGNEDDDDLEKYLELLEKPERRTKFINSAVAIVKEYGFDGIDLSWQFPPRNEKYESYTFGSIWHKVKKTFGVGVDSKAAEHRDQFTALVRELKGALRSQGNLLSLGVLPHINNTLYYDVRSLMPHLDLVNLWTADFRTPERVPKQADFAAPLYFMYGRQEHQNSDYIVRYWLQNGGEPNKLHLGIPTWGRGWKTTSEAGVSGVPPLIADGPSSKAPQTKVEGLLAYYEVCNRLVSPTNPHAPATLLRRVGDPTKRLGTYAYNNADKDHDGSWISFEEPESAAYKAAYAKAKGLGGVAVLDVALDDSKGLCDGTKFPITRAAKLSL